MSNLLTGDLARVITNAVNPLLSDLIYTQQVGAIDDEGSRADVTTDVLTRGVITEYDKFYIMVGAVEIGDYRCIILRNKLTVTPALKDRITTAAGRTFEIVEINEDPARAAYEMRVREVD